MIKDKFINSIVLAVAILLFSCSNNQESKNQTLMKLDIQGHRGARGLLPENTLEGFAEALKLGVTTLEMDLAVSGDRQVLVSHEPYFSSEICLDPQGEEIPEDSATLLNILMMDYEEIKKYDCGSKFHSRFPDQRKMTTYKPLLSEVLQLAKSFAEDNNKDLVNFNIELKSLAPYDNIFHPDPKAFSDLVYSAIDGQVPWSNVTIQSFDFRILQYFNSTYPDVQLALLIENELDWKNNIDSLGFTPDTYSSYYKRHSEQNVSQIQKAGMKVIPWTVNDSTDMKELVSWKVDGLITDFPNIAVKLFK